MQVKTLRTVCQRLILAIVLTSLFVFAVQTVKAYTCPDGTAPCGNTVFGNPQACCVIGPPSQQCCGKQTCIWIDISGNAHTYTVAASCISADKNCSDLCNG
jgi:hypothetical protein